MALYPFTESSTCVCSAASAASLASLAKEASTSAVWAVMATAALFCGALLGCMEVAKDHVLLAADQLFLKVVRRRSRWVLGPGQGARWPIKETMVVWGACDSALCFNQFYADCQVAV